MNVKGQHSTVGVIPGGTANVWAGEVGVPVDPVKSALTLVNSEARKVDIGHVEVEGLTFPGAAQNDHAVDQINPPRKGNKSRKGKASSKARHHFLLMAGLGVCTPGFGYLCKPPYYPRRPPAAGLSPTEEPTKQHPLSL